MKPAILCFMLVMGAIPPAIAVTVEEAQVAVAAFYQQCLGRTPDYPGAQGWVDALVVGTLTPDQVRIGICTSSEGITFQQHQITASNSGSLAPPVVVIPGLTGQEVFNTGPFPCDGIARRTVFANQSSRILAIRKVLHWHGLNFRTAADFDSRVTRGSDGATVSPFMDDHYGDAVGQTNSLVLDFPVPMRLLTGDALHLVHVCNGQSTQGHVQVFVWWEWEP